MNEKIVIYPSDYFLTEKEKEKLVKNYKQKKCSYCGELIEDYYDETEVIIGANIFPMHNKCEDKYYGRIIISFIF